MERATTGPIFSENDFNMKVLIPNVRKVVKEFDIQYDPEDPLAADDALADCLFEAAVEFVVRTGLYCDATNRVIQVDRGEIVELGVGLVYRGGGTTAGTGILGRLLQMRTGIPVSQIYIVTDGGVILVAGLVFGWEKGLYALMTLFVWGLAADYVLEGPSVVRTAFIITDKPQAVAHAVLSNLRLGVTAWPAQGMFTKSEHTVLFCTVSRPYEGALKSVVAGVDPDAFLVIGHGHQASGGVLGRAAYDD